jgi:hypothetical protein
MFGRRTEMRKLVKDLKGFTDTLHARLSSGELSLSMAMAGLKTRELQVSEAGVQISNLRTLATPEELTELSAISQALGVQHEINTKVSLLLNLEQRNDGVAAAQVAQYLVVLNGQHGELVKKIEIAAKVADLPAKAAVARINATN